MYLTLPSVVAPVAGRPPSRPRTAAGDSGKGTRVCCTALGKGGHAPRWASVSPLVK